MASSNLSSVESQALSALELGGSVANLLSPGGAAGAAVGDILAAASDAFSLVNTANAALANFATPPNDPIAAAFSGGQPYPGAFITSPQITQLTPVNFSQALASSTQALSQLSTAQQTALSAQTGVTLNTDADLASAMSVVFAQTQNNRQLAFSINLNDTAAITPVASTTITSGTRGTTPREIISTTGGTTTVSTTGTPSATPVAITIPPLTVSPNMTNLSAFVSQISGSFPNTPGVSGVAASIWVDGLGVSVNASGTPIMGVPVGIGTGLLSDISTAAINAVPTIPPVIVVDYSVQQNQFNLVVALSIDNGLTTTITSLMASPLVTPATYQVIKNRLLSVAQRGDAAMLATLFTILGPTDTPNEIVLLTVLLSNLQPIDQPNATIATPTITASGITITTTSNALTTAQIIADVNTMLTFLDLTITEICSQNTCNEIVNGQSLLNSIIIADFNQPVIENLLGTTTVQMAMMLA